MYPRLRLLRSQQRPLHRNKDSLWPRQGRKRAPHLRPDGLARPPRLRPRPLGLNRLHRFPERGRRLPHSLRLLR